MMSDRDGAIAVATHFIHRRFLWFLSGSYVAASLAPGVGLQIKNLTFADFTIFREQTKITLPTALLGLLLFNAGLGTQIASLRHLARCWTTLGSGLVANLFIPVAFIFGVTHAMGLWHNPDEVQNILVGLALVASMPIAGSSTAWSQNANGNLSLSLGLVLVSTLLSPWTTPLALHAVGLMTTGDYSEDLHELASSGTGGFLFACVLLPSLLGVGISRMVPESRLNSAKPLLKLTNFAALLVLNYSNAAVSLPQTVHDPDWDFLLATLGVVVALCVCAFAAGWLVSHLLRTQPADKTSLIFGLGMNNNGTGLVLASMALADHPRVLLPIVFYNLVQHLVAGVADRLLSRANGFRAIPAATQHA